MSAEAAAIQTLDNRIARFQDLKVLGHIANGGLAQEALDLIYAGKLLPVITLAENGDTPVAAGAPILGAGGMSMVFASNPPGQGPSLHRHDETFETFIVLQGEYEFTWGDEGEHSVVLGQYDVLS